MTQSERNSKFELCAQLLEERLPHMNMWEQTVIRAYIVGLRSPDPKAWARANQNLFNPIASILKIDIHVPPH